MGIHVILRSINHHIYYEGLGNNLENCIKILNDNVNITNFMLRAGKYICYENCTGVKEAWYIVPNSEAFEFTKALTIELAKASIAITIKGD